MEVDWDAVQQILTLLVLFVAPAILNFLRGRRGEDENDQVETAFEVPEKLTDPRPSHRRDASAQERLARIVAARAQKAQDVELKRMRERDAQIKLETTSLPTSPPKYKMPSRGSPQEEVTQVRRKSGSRLGRLSNAQVRRAWILKEVLDEPRAIKPF